VWSEHYCALYNLIWSALNSQRLPVCLQTRSHCCGPTVRICRSSVVVDRGRPIDGANAVPSIGDRITQCPSVSPVRANKSRTEARRNYKCEIPLARHFQAEREKVKVTPSHWSRPCIRKAVIAASPPQLLISREREKLSWGYPPQWHTARREDPALLVLLTRKPTNKHEWRSHDLTSCRQALQQTTSVVWL